MCDNIPLADPHYLSFLKLPMAIDLSRVFSHHWPEVFHISLRIRKTQPRGWKKRKANNHGLGLAASARREKSDTLLCILCFCGLTRECTRVKLPQATSNADISSRVGQPGLCWSTGLSSHLSDFCWLASSLPSSHL